MVAEVKEVLGAVPGAEGRNSPLLLLLPEQTNPIPSRMGVHRSAAACVLQKKLSTGQEELCVDSRSLPGAYADAVGYSPWRCLRARAFHQLVRKPAFLPRCW